MNHMGTKTRERERETFTICLSLTANFPTDRRDSSRSPSRYDAQGRRFKEEMGQERDDGRFDGDYQHAARLQQWDNHDYSGMYDEEDGSREDLGARAYTGDRHHGNHRHNGRDGSRTGSDSRGYRGNSRSRSPTREAGRPSDTVILENLPSRISPKEVRELPIQDITIRDQWSMLWLQSALLE